MNARAENRWSRWSAAMLGLVICAVLMIGCSRGAGGARTTADTNRIKGQTVDGAHLVDAGNTTPEAALETGFWAAATGNYEVHVAGYTARLRDEVDGQKRNRERYARDMRRKFEHFQDFRIVARKAVAEDKVELRYQFQFADRTKNAASDRAEKIAVMVNEHGAWKCAETKSYSGEWDAGSEPEP